MHCIQCQYLCEDGHGALWLHVGTYVSHMVPTGIYSCIALAIAAEAQNIYNRLYSARLDFYRIAHNCKTHTDAACATGSGLLRVPLQRRQLSNSGDIKIYYS